jgi:hypothetical protein
VTGLDGQTGAGAGVPRCVRRVAYAGPRLRVQAGPLDSLGAAVRARRGGLGDAAVDRAEAGGLIDPGGGLAIRRRR